jgi:cell wall-associated NlpC family hydrolase
MRLTAVGLLILSVSVVLAFGVVFTPRSTDGAITPVSCVVPEADELQLSPPQVAVVTAIVGVAKGLGVRRRGVTIALQTAMQESTLRADAVSGQAVGAFQQIPPGPLGAYGGYDRTDPAAAAKGFFTVLQHRVPAYDTDPRTNHELAQVVQASGAGADEYAKHQRWAEAVTATLFDGSAQAMDCTDQSVTGPITVHLRDNTVELPPEAGVPGKVIARSPQVAKAIAAALAWLGTPYAWGGGNANGPTKGTTDNGGPADAHGDSAKTGFDCSGLTLYAYAQAGVQIVRPSDAQLTRAKLVVPFTEAQPGDLLFWGTHHVAMYLGVHGGAHRMVEAPQSGDVVKVSTVRTGGDFRNVAARPIPGGNR